MPDLLRRVQNYAIRHGLWTPETRVVAAVSGGADSVALLLILHALGRTGGPRLAGVAHLHHHIRGAQADADAAFVQCLADRLGVTCLVGHADVPALARANHQSLEVAGRRARLAFFESARASAGADRVAVAHTRSDQAETVLLRLARGAGPRGLAAMAPRTGARIRPQLDVGRHDLRAWLRARGEAWHEDATNEDASQARNRIRLDVLPALAALNPRVEEALARTARILAADADLLEALARADANRLVRQQGGEVTMDLEEIARLPEALARRIVLGALDAVDASRAHGLDETDAVLHTTGAHLDIGRVGVERNRGKAVLSIRPPERHGLVDEADEGPRPVSVPGVIRHPRGWWQIEVAGPMDPAAAPERSRQCVALDADALGRHLTVRAWRAGDRLQPLGMRGRKKLQDIFVDRKVPQELRRQVPVVLDAQQRIAWVAGHVTGEAFRVTPRSVAVIVLTLRR